MNKWTKLLLVTILIAGLVVGMSNALPTRAAPGDFLYLVNAGGPATGSWEADTAYLVTGGESTEAFPDAIASVPAEVPEEVFQSHRWDPADGDNMLYQFSVPSGMEVTVFLYFAEIWPSFTDAGSAGDRVFNVDVEGTVLSNIDVFAANGGYTAYVRSASVVSDGTIDIEFSPVVPRQGAPMVSGIAIQQISEDPTPPPTDEPTGEPTDEPTGEPTDEPTGEPTEEPTVEPTEPPVVIPDMFCSLGDGSLNALHCGRPVAIYDESSFEIFGIDINTGNGALAFVVTDEQIAEAGVPEDVPVVIATGQNPYNFRPIVLYRLPSGEFQLNTYYWDGKPYSVKWDEGASTVEVVTW